MKEPKQKAEELIDKFITKTELNISESMKEIILECAKRRALICVEEIIKTEPLKKCKEDHDYRGMEVWYEDMTNYWQEVKKHLE